MLELSSLIPSRPPLYAPMTERDETILSTAAWLDAEGYTPAAAVLRAVVGRHEIVTLEELKANPDILSSLKSRLDIQCRIWSDERRGYWRPDGHGYTSSALEAGIYAFWAAYASTSHCGPEKGICYEILPESAARPEKVSGWKS